MNEKQRWRRYRRTNAAEMRPYQVGEDLTGISISGVDENHIVYCEDAGINPQGYVARNPTNHVDQWYVSQSYFHDNFEEVTDAD